jgi:hypothetical protein
MGSGVGSLRRLYGSLEMAQPLLLILFFAVHGVLSCSTIGARVLIDDNPSYALECAAAGIHVLLYDWGGAYPWSKLPAAG